MTVASRPRRSCSCRDRGTDRRVQGNPL